MPAFYGAIDLLQNELRNARVQNLGAAPASPVTGQLYYNSSSNTLFWWNGTAWIAASDIPTPAATASSLGTIQLAGALSGSATAPTLAANSVGSSQITDGSIALADLNGTSVRLDTIAAPTGPVNLNNQTIQNLGAPVNPNDAVNKTYVDGVAQGLDAKPSVKAATTGANITLSGTQTIDGVALVAGDRVLVKDQTTAAQNGIYVVASGAWTRALDMDTWAEVPGAFTFVEQGTVNADTGWLSTADQGGTLGTTAITWVQFSAAGQVVAGAGLTKTGQTIDLVAGDTSLLVSADSVVVNPAWLTSQNVTKKYAATLTGTASPETITHNLNTRDVQVTVLNGASPYTAVEVDWDATTVNSVTVRYNPNLGAGYRIVVVG